MQTLQELVDTAIQSESPHQPQLVISPSWLTGAGRNPEEVWRALLTLGMCPQRQQHQAMQMTCVLIKVKGKLEVIKVKGDLEAIKNL